MTTKQQNAKYEAFSHLQIITDNKSMTLIFLYQVAQPTSR